MSKEEWEMSQTFTAVSENLNFTIFKKLVFVSQKSDDIFFSKLSLSRSRNFGPTANNLNREINSWF